MNHHEEANKGNYDIDIVVEKSHDLLSGGTVPKLLKKSAGGEKCCIFRIPRRLRNNHYKDAYEPSVVSIGPYHNGKEHLQMIQEHKHRFLGLFMAEANKKGVEMKDLVEAVSELEEDIRESYSESLYNDDDPVGRKKLIEMMVLDGCFILVLFLVVARKVRYSDYHKDPIFVMLWIIPAIRSDLLLLENQVPYFLLQTIFEKSKIVTSRWLTEIIISFFKYAIDISYSLKHAEPEVKHLLDLIRVIIMPIIPKKGKYDMGLPRDLPHRSPFLKLIPSATTLRFRGIKLELRNKAETVLEIRHKRNLLEIPPMIFDDYTILFFLNCVAFEDYYAYCTKHITSYVVFMQCLLESEDDARLLSRKGIITNYMGTMSEISQFFQVISRDCRFNLDASYLADTFIGVNENISRGWHAHWAAYKNTHLTYNTSRTCLSRCTGLTILLLTILQAVVAVYAYYRPPK